MRGKLLFPVEGSPPLDPPTTCGAGWLYNHAVGHKESSGLAAASTFPERRESRDSKGHRRHIKTSEVSHGAAGQNSVGVHLWVPGGRCRGKEGVGPDKKKSETLKTSTQ